MHTYFFFFFIFLILFSVNSAYAETIRAFLLAEGEKSFADDKIVLEDNETFDLQNNVISIIDEFTETVGSISVDLTQEVTFVADDNDVITLENTALDTVTVEIPDRTTLSAPEGWDKTISPPIEIPTTGEIPSGFQTPDNVIQVGSPDFILIFDKTVTIILEDVTGQTAYKLPGEEIWNLINGCTGTYDDPDDPVFPNECSISDGTDTKIITYHFTEFGKFEEIVEETVEQTTTSSTSGGSHRTGISVVNPKINDEIKSSSALPIWLTHPVIWWNSNQISAQEFSSIMGWLIDEDIIKIEDKTKPEKQIITMAPSTKHLFSLWEGGIISESIIINLIETYRGYGVW